ncbi:efflux RND transporter periplasmic adaptor subunit [Phenylobacterium sp.]|jgi:RND family efflux transporter MFP subunit|uniref:efflux RND transporter periplasmic adaptor subunit n=1 Tax=Phenylobacterium sp. TaxID=1871053 RepID=UPI002E31B533|nr:efflux RND transporter periplasmic adaptor subunit [Phenylobacterium sp.]HEX2560562.1 efflux RND transporter periplasmic adaptor subunit [Phenylobacterium sp.]
MLYKLAPVAAAGAAAILLASCNAQGQDAPAPPPPQVSVAVPLQQTVVEWQEFPGRFDAPQHVEVRARAGGFLQAAHFTEGSFVKKGQLLFTLDPRPAQAQLAAARAQADLARRELSRAEALLKAQAISQEEYENRRAAFAVAEAAVRSRALDLEFTRVTAPVSGVVSDRRVDPGNVVAGGSSQADVLTTVVSVSPIHFVFDASEGQLLERLRRGAGQGRVQIRLQDETEHRWVGRIDFLDNAVDGRSGAVRMRAVVENPGGFLRPGMFGRARVESGAAYSALLVPDTAVVTDGARRAVHVVAPDGSTSLRPVTLGPLQGGLRIIRAGLKPTDRVVVGGVQRIMPGQKVQVRTTKLTPTSAPAAAARAAPPPAAAIATPVAGA